jgi:hypothetical protein
MKKLSILFALVLLLSSCVCTIGQVPPPQFINVDQTCGAAVPNYIPMFTYSDNCGIDTVEQTPTAGTWLTLKDNPVTTILIRAKDYGNNVTDMMFTLTLIDPIPPTIELLDSTLITDNLTKINNAYNMADRMLAYQELWFDSAFDYDAVGIPDTLQPFQQYFNKILVTWTTPMLAFTGTGGRWHTFINESDTLLIVPKADNWIGLLK